MDWFRSVHGAPTHKKWLAVSRRCHQPVAVVVAVAWSLMDYASRQKERGSIAGFDAEDQAAYLDIEVQDVDFVMQAFEEKGWVVNGRITSWDEHQTKREDGASERAKAWRDRKRTETNAAERTRTPERDTDSDTETTSDEVVEGGALPLAPRPAKPVKAKPTHWPEDAVVPDDWRAWGRERRPDIDIDVEAEKFANYWPEKRTPAGQRTNWNKTWRNWVLGAKAQGNGKRSDRDSVIEGYDAIAARYSARS